MTVQLPAVRDVLEQCLDQIRFNGDAQRFSGKVRENFCFADGTMVIAVTDRVSVFDYKIGTIPYKGQILNQLAAWCFAGLDEIQIPHHMLGVIHPNLSLVRKATPLLIEMIVRAYLTGTTTTSSWHAYQHHGRMICGLEMPPGMKKNEPFSKPISTPTTKASAGHDENLSKAEILARGLVPETVLEDAERYAFKMFSHGQRVARERGLILVDTKYEMGWTAEEELIVIDEVHTPDSSRYWVSDSYDARLSAGAEPESLDKEFVRRMIIDRGYDVNSSTHPAQFLTDEIRIAAAEKYLELYVKMTGETPDIRVVDENELLDVLAKLSAGK